MTDTTTLTRSKLVTREIKETLAYTFFGKCMVAVHVHVAVTGVDPFKADHYAVMPRETFDSVMKEVAKAKIDFPFRDIIIEKDQSFKWYKVTAAELKSFKTLPITNRKGNNAYELVIAEQETWKDKKLHAARPKKIYQAAMNKPTSLVSFKHDDHTFRDHNDVLISLPIYVDYGITSSNYLMKPMVTYLRTLDNIGMVTEEQSRQYTKDEKYPEIKTVPYYNAEYEGETEVKLWVLPTDEQYSILKGGDGRKYIGTDLWNLTQYGVLDLSTFKLEKNDD